MVLSSGKSKTTWGLSLTSQEKKVLGFVLLLAVLGAVRLGWKAWREAGNRPLPATAPPAASSKVK